MSNLKYKRPSFTNLKEEFLEQPHNFVMVISSLFTILFFIMFLTTPSKDSHSQLLMLISVAGIITLVFLSFTAYFSINYYTFSLLSHRFINQALTSSNAILNRHGASDLSGTVHESSFGVFHYNVQIDHPQLKPKSGSFFRVYIKDDKRTYAHPCISFCVDNGYLKANRSFNFTLFDLVFKRRQLNAFIDENFRIITESYLEGMSY